MLEIKEKQIQAIGQELTGKENFTVKDLEAWFHAYARRKEATQSKAYEDFLDLTADYYKDPVEFLRATLQIQVSRQACLLEEIFADDLVPAFLEAHRPQGPLVFAGRTLMAYDETQALTERVFVETAYSTTNSDHGDLIEVYIARPKELTSGVPMVYVANPYLMGSNDEPFNDENIHPIKEDYAEPVTDMKGPEKYKEAVPRQGAKLTAKTRTIKLPQLEGVNPAFSHFISRGYALVYTAGRGSYYSQGFNISGSPLEIDAVDSVLRWVDGDAQAFYDLEGQEKVEATWSNGSVGMTGLSYLGTMQFGVSARTKSKSLKTIVPEAGIINWYDYYRHDGLVVAPQGYPGEDIDLLTWYCESFLMNPTNTSQAKEEAFFQELEKVTHDMDRSSGQYNDFWDIRNFMNEADQIQVPMLIVHGSEDWNVRTSHLFKAMEATKGTAPSRNFILHRGQHVSIHPLAQFNYLGLVGQWFDHYLLNIGEATWSDGEGWVQSPWDPEDWSVVQHGDKKTWTFTSKDQQTLIRSGSLQGAWQNLEGRIRNLGSGESRSESSVLKFQDKIGFPAISSWEKDLLDKKSDSSLIWTSRPFDTDFWIHGNLNVHLQAQADVNQGALSAMVIDVGEAHRLNKRFKETGAKERIGMKTDLALKHFERETEKTPYKIISRGWVNLANPETGGSQEDFQNYQIQMIQTDYLLPKGHQLALVVYGYDYEYTLHPIVPHHYQVLEDSLVLEIESLTDQPLL